MGQHADDILDGSVCEGCGEWFGDVIAGKEPPGYPRRCEQCRPMKKRRRKPRVGAAIACAASGKGGGGRP